jgi:hypothetical protein
MQKNQEYFDLLAHKVAQIEMAKREKVEGQGFRGRLISEHHGLVRRIGKLETFIKSGAFKDLDDIEKQDLREQCECMQKYNDVLTRRLERLCAQPDEQENNSE